MAGCVSQEIGKPAESQSIQPVQTLVQSNPQELEKTPQVPAQIGTPKVSEPSQRPETTKIPAITATLTQQKTPSVETNIAKDLPTFIKQTFPTLTENYIAIKAARNALNDNEIQDQSLRLEQLIQNIRKTYQLERPNVEKRVFPGLDSKQEIIFNKYLGFMIDLEGYATNLKNAIYYKQIGGDPTAPMTASRYLGQAEQSEQKTIATVKTMVDYCKDFGYLYLDPVSAESYSNIK
ncbi:MAG TPA: hypothetical protein VN372_15365 [Methanospirillum sp.]|nr:hypothetical protein [Methanospirillum sp.]